ncbi:hypothetical protein TREES_T100002578 [Tupaia chinensis]|uniref:Uncharacterized protein n=1 Tax=Tupaia chinensis TaxID=246437 RepID=L9L9M6_TUPCH|nr:hypothetical protein TREES_T100002578 [Tupaia chinensis]
MLLKDMGDSSSFLLRCFALPENPFTKFTQLPSLRSSPTKLQPRCPKATYTDCPRAPGQNQPPASCAQQKEKQPGGDRILRRAPHCVPCTHSFSDELPTVRCARIPSRMSSPPCAVHAFLLRRAPHRALCTRSFSDELPTVRCARSTNSSPFCSPLNSSVTAAAGVEREWEEAMLFICTELHLFPGPVMDQAQQPTPVLLAGLWGSVFSSSAGPPV